MWDALQLRALFPLWLSSFRRRLPHGSLRVQHEAALKPSNDRIAQPGQPVAWPRESTHSIPNAIVVVPFNHEELLTLLDVGGERAIGKPEAVSRPLFVHNVNDAARVHPPDAKNVGQHDHVVSNFDEWMLRMNLGPGTREHSPLSQGLAGRLENLHAFSEMSSIVVNIEPNGAAFA